MEPLWAASGTRHGKLQKVNFLGRPVQQSVCCTFVLLDVANVVQMGPKCLDKLHILDGDSTIKKLRFDCAGTSGSRVRHSKKTQNKQETSTCERTLRASLIYCKR